MILSFAVMPIDIDIRFFIYYSSFFVTSIIIDTKHIYVADEKMAY